MPPVPLVHGMFAWTDLVAHDPDEAKAFYGDLFGWTPAPLPDHPASAYTLFTLGGDRVAGLTPMSAGMKERGVPPMWVSYVLVDDVDAVAARVETLGGRVPLPPMDVVDSGRMSMIVDPSGGSVALWQAGRHRGAERFNEPGCLTWNELMTRDAVAARDFYRALLGWTFEAVDLGERGTYHLARVDGRPNAGIMDFPPDVPAEVPPWWDVYFAVEDVDEAVRRATELGATLVVPPTTISMGTFALVRDPRGAHFTVWRAA